MANIGTVVSISGSAIIVDANGGQRALKVGDIVNTNDTIIATNGAQVGLQLANNSQVQIASQQTVTITQELSDAILYDLIDPNNNAVTQSTIQGLIQAINTGDNIDDIINDLATNASNANQSADNQILANQQGHSFVELLRLDDVLNQFDYNYDVASREYLDTNPLDQDRDAQAGDALSGEGFLPRIDQDLNSFKFAYKTTPLVFETRRYNEIIEANDEDYARPNQAPVASFTSIAGLEDGAPAQLNLSGTDSTGSVTQVTITSLPNALTQGSLFYQVDGAGPLIAIVANAPISIANAAFVRFVPVANFNGVVSIPFFVTDNNGSVSPTINATVTVIAVNDTPVAVDDIYAVTEDTTVTGNVSGNDIDVDSSEINANNLIVTQFSFSVAGVVNSFAPSTTPVVIVGVGSITLQGNGNFSFTPAPNYFGPVPVISYTVTDGLSPAIGKLILGPVSNTPDAPVANDDAIAVTEDIAVIGNVLTNDTDADGDLLKVSAVQVDINGDGIADALDIGTPTLITNNLGIAIGTLIFNSDGSFNFSPAPNYVGSVPAITYTVSDGLGGTDTGTLNLGPLTNTPDTPTANPDTVTINEDDTNVVLNLLGNDSDADGTTPSIQSINGVVLTPGFAQTISVTNGIVNVSAAGVVTFSPAPNFNGAINFAYVITDGASSASGSVSINVTAVNDAPTATAATSATPTEDGAAVAIPLAGIDIDGSIASFTIVSGPTAAQGALTYDDDNNVNTARVAVPLGIALLPVQAATVTFTPAANYFGVVNPVVFNVIDNSGTTSVANATINIPAIASINDAPVANNATITPTEDQSIAVPLSGSDIDGTIASFTITAGPSAAQGTLVYDNDGNPATPPVALALNTPLTPLEAASVRFLPTANYNGVVAPVTYTVTDNLGSVSAPATITIANIANVNDAPTAQADSGSVTESGVNPGNTAFTGTPSVAGNVTSNDTDVDASDTKTVTIVNGQAVAAGTPLVLIGTYGTLSIAANGSYTYTLDNNKPATQALDQGVAGTPEVFNYTMVDSADAPSSSTLTISVTGTNDQPVANVDVASTNIGVALNNINVLANDVELDAADTLSVTTATLANPALGTVSINTTGPNANTLNFTPAATTTGNVVINYTITDSHGATSTSTLTVNVGTNTPPTGTDITKTINEDASLTLGTTDFGFNDADAGQSLGAVSIDSLPAIGTGTLTLNGAAVVAGDLIPVASITAGNLVFTPTPNANGTNYANFTFSVQDNVGGFDTTPNTLTIDVTAQNDVPTAIADANSITERKDNTAPNITTGNVLGGAGVSTNDKTDTDIDLPAQTLNVNQVQFGANPVVVVPAGATGATLNLAYGSLVIKADGTYTYTLDNTNTTVNALNVASAALTEVVTYRITDNNGGISSTTLTINVNGINDSPTATVSTINALEDPVNPIPVPLTGTDPDSQIAFISVTTLPLASQGVLSYDDDNDAATPRVAVVANTALTPAQAASMVFTPALNFNGTVNIAFSATDNQGATSPIANTAIIIAAVNDAPDAINDANTTPINGVATGNLITGGTPDNDVDTPTAQLSITQFSVAGIATPFTVTPGTPGNATIANVGTLTVAADGSYTFTPLANFNGAIPVVTYTLSDNAATPLTDTATLTLSMGNNAPPVDGNEVDTTNEDATLTVAATASTGLLANATDANNNPLTVTSFLVAGNPTPISVTPGTPGLANIANVGTLTINANGSYSFNPAPDFNGAVPTITYTVSDGLGGLDTSTLNLSVTPVADAPVNSVPAATQATVEDSAKVFSAATGNAITVGDVDGAAVNLTTTISVTNGSFNAIIGGATITGNGTNTVTITGTAAQINAALNGASYTNTPDYNGSATLTVTTSDATATAPAVDVISMSISQVADIENDALSTNEDTSITFNPIAGTNGASIDSFEGAAAQVTQLNVNGTPVNVGGSITTLEGTISLGTNNLVTFTPALNFNGAVPLFTYTVTSGGTTETANINMSVTAVNDAPVANNATTATPTEDGAAISIPLAASDIDGTITSFTIISGPSAAQGTLSYDDDNNPATPAVAVPFGTPLTPAQAASVTFTPAANYFGAINPISFNATDNSGTASAIATITIPGIVNVNDAPVAIDDTITAIEDTQFTSTVALIANDTDVDSTLTAVAGTFTTSQGGTLVLAANGSYTYTPAPNFFGTDTVNYSVTDGTLNDIGTLTITVNAANDAPIANDDAITAIEDTQFTSTVALIANDTDVDSSLTAVAGTFTTNQGGTLVLAANGSYTYTPAPNFFGTDTVNYTVTDGVLSDIGQLTITVTPVNDAPIAVADTATTPINVTINNINVKGNDTDVDNTNAQLTVSAPALTNPAQGTVTLNPDGTLNFSPATGVTGPVTITYTVTDPAGLTSVGTLTVNVGANNPPTSSDITKTVNEDTPLTLASADFAFNDVDAGQSLTAVRIDSLATNGTLTLNDVAVSAGQIIAASSIAAGNLVFTPALNANGNNYANFTFSVQDNAGAFDTVPNTVTVNVTPVNDAPIAVNDNYTMNEDGAAITLTPLALDSDVDGTTPTIASINGTALTPGIAQTITVTNGTVNINAAGVITFSPALNFNGTVNFPYVITDGTATATANQIITVSAVNDAPIAVNDTYTMAEDSAAITLTPLALDSDIDGTTPTIQSINGTALTPGIAQTIAVTNGTVNINAAGVITYTPALNFNGTVNFPYVITDGTATATANQVITVTAVNDAPVNSVPAAQTTPEDTPRVFSTANANAITVNDLDGAGEALTTTITVTNGVFNALAFAGATITGNATGTVIISGTAAAINGALQGASYSNNPDYNGPALLTIATSDGTLTDNDTVGITITPVVDITNDVLTTNEDTAISFNPILGTNGATVDSFEGTTPQITQINGTNITAGGASVAVTNGSVTLAAGNLLTFTPALNFNGAVPAFTYTVASGGVTEIANITVTVNAQNDPATISGTVTGTVVEAGGVANATLGTPTASATLTSADVDNPANTFQAVAAGAVTTNNFGTYAMSAGGTWTYTVNNNNPTVQALRTTANTLTDSFTVFSIDGTAQVITLTIQGGNDAPIAVLDSTTAVTEAGVNPGNTVFAGTPTAMGNILTNDTDIDAGDTKTLTFVNATSIAAAGNTTIIGKYGSLSIDASGAYTYTLNNADADTQALTQGQVVTDEVFNYTVQDTAGLTSTSTLTVNITGTNDAPILTTASTISYTENAAATPINTTITVSDVDNATLSTSTVAITTNFVSGQDTLSFTNVPATMGNITANYNAATGVLSLSSAGNTATPAQWQAALRAVSYSNSSENPSTLARTISFTVNDSAANSNTVDSTINVNAVNDPAIISGTVTGTVVEAGGVANATLGTPSASATLTSTDVDNPANTFQAVAAGAATSNNFGTYAMSAGGTWTYTVNNNNPTVQALRTTANTLTDSFTVFSIDGTAQVITLTIQGGNDAPIAVLDSTTAVTEAGVNPGNTVFAGTPTAIGNILTNDTDIDAGDTKTLTFVNATSIAAAGNTTIIGKYGSISIDASGAYTYTLNNADADTQALTQGQVVTDEVFNYTVQDTAGLTSTSTLTVNITGTNDIPTANGNSNTTNEDTAIAVVIEGSDVDGTIATFRLSSLPTNGRLFIDSTLSTDAVIGVDYAATGNARTFYFLPASDFNSTIITTGNPPTFNTTGVVPSFNFTATDNNGAVSATATESIIVTAISDGQPDGTDDAFQTLVGATITFTRAQLLGNDILPDHATINLTSGLPAGLSYNAGTETYTWTPTAAGVTTFTYTLVDDENEGSVLPLNTTVTLTAFNSVDDIATVNESALATGTGGGFKVVSGNLFTNDVVGLSGNVTGLTNAGGTANLNGDIYTLVTTTGTLVVDRVTGAYTYTLNAKIDNDSAAPAGVTPVSAIDALQTFAYTRTVGSANLRVNILDDAPIAQNSVIQVTANALPTYKLAFVLDVSGSMSATGGVTKQVNPITGVVTYPTRLDVAINALRDLGAEYFRQTSNVTIDLITIGTGSTFIGSYSSLDAFLGVMKIPPAFATGGSTNYQAGLDLAVSSLGQTVDPAKQNIVYFLSDGSSTVGGTNNSGDNSTEVVLSGTNNFTYNQYLANNPAVRSFAVGIGTGIADASDLNAIHNISSVAGDTKDPATIVADLSTLSDTLLTTVPATFGGNLLAGGKAVQGVSFGADGGFISQITLQLDTDNNILTPEVAVTFTYNPVTSQISSSLAGFPIAGSILTVNSTRGFTHGTLVFDFATADFSYFTAGVANAGTKFDINFTATDNDGDSTTAVQSFSVVAGKPVAHSDTDTLFAKNSFLEGNVITGVGTDGGVQLGTAVTGFTPKGTGVDDTADNAKLTSMVFKGISYDLTTNASGSGVGFIWAITGTSDDRRLTWTSTSGGESLTFDQSGYYKYVPPTVELPNSLAGSAIPTVTPTLLVSNAAVTEAASTYAVFTVSLTGANATATTVTLALGNGTATVGTDTSTSAALQFSIDKGINWTTGTTAAIPAGQTSILVRTLIANDATSEALVENFTLTATAAAGTANTSATGFGAITDNSVMHTSTPATVSIGDVVVNEGAGTATFTITLNQAPTANVNITWATGVGSATATAGADYTASSGTAAFTVGGALSQTFTVPISEDTTIEGTETFLVNITSATPAVATVIDGQAVGYIQDNESTAAVIPAVLPTLQVANASATEGGFAVFKVSLTAPNAAATTFNLALANGTATVGTDTGATAALQVSIDGGLNWTTSTTGSIAAGQTSVLVRTLITDDATVEPQVENFILTATRTGTANTANASADGYGSIIDNEVLPTVTISDVTVAEGGTASFTVTLSKAPTANVNINWATAPGSASAGTDYSTLTGTLTFTAGGALTQTIPVPVATDAIAEGTETFFIDITSANTALAIIADGRGTASITGGATAVAPTLSVSNASMVEMVGAFAHFTVSLSAASATATTVSLALANGTATVGTDTGATAALEFSTNNGVTWTIGTSATIAIGQTSLLVRTAITNDATIEAQLENFTLTATRSAGTTANLAATGYGLITDHSPSLVSISDVVVDEVTGFAFMTVSLHQAPAANVNINLAAVAGSATVAIDYTASFEYSLTGGLTWIAATSIPFTTTASLVALVRMPILSDAVLEGSETLFVNITSSNTANAIIADGQALVTIRDNDPSTTVTFNAATTVASLIATEGILLEAINTVGATVGAVVTFQVAGVGVTGAGTQQGNTAIAPTAGGNNFIDNLESLVVTFDRAKHPNGVQNLGFVVNVTSNLVVNAVNSLVLSYTLYGIDGNLLGQFSSAQEGTAVAIPDIYTNIGKVVILANNNVTATISSITYTDVALDTVAAAVAPEVIDYTLTGASGATSTASLTLNIMANELAGDANDNTVIGTAANDHISGLTGNDSLSGGAGYDLIEGGAGNDTIFGGTEGDTLAGNAGSDVIFGEAGNDIMRGGDGNDSLIGGTGSDTIIGGAGNDMLTGGTGALGLDTSGVDTFKWELADKGGLGVLAAQDTITDFNNASVALGGDVLDLRDLLTNENHNVGVGNLASYLHFEFNGSDTVIHISDNGSFDSGFNAAKDVQTITLTNVNLTTGFANDQAIIADLLSKQKLITD